MSKPFIADQPRIRLEPAEQIQAFVRLYEPRVSHETVARFSQRIDELGLHFSREEQLILAALDTPARVQEFLNAQIYYNYDHSSADQEETSLPPRLILQQGHAHCFEGALFAYAVDYLHGHNPRLVLVEASQDPDHNLVVMQDPQTFLWGANAHSGWAHLDGRPFEYKTIRAMVETYVPYYISDLTNDPQDLTLVGYSEPFDLVKKFGTVWIGSLDPLWDMYYTYVDESIRFHYLFDDSPELHLYPLVRALKDKWIVLDSQGKPVVNAANLPPGARALWHRFWKIFDPPVRPTRGRAREIEQEFMRLTGTTPIDLQDNADDFIYYLDAGYKIEQLLTESL